MKPGVNLNWIDALLFLFPTPGSMRRFFTGVQQLIKGRLRPVRLACCLAMVLSAGPLPGAGWSSQSVPQYDRLFQHTNGWIGADGDYTVALTNNLTLWLFSDTFIGEVHDHRRGPATMIHNSAALQQGNDLAAARLSFYQGKSPDGKPAALISPADGRGWFWLFDGVMAHGKLFLFLVQIEPTDNKSVFGFRQIGNWLGEVSNPLDPPPQWHILQTKIPFAQFTAPERVSFGAATLVTNGYVYIYGTRDQKAASRTMILARAPEADPGNFALWQFRAHDNWTTNVSEAADLCGGLASEYSVSWLPARQRFVVIYTENGLSEKILARTAPEPWGNWSEPQVVYHCPEAGWDKRIFCYAAKAHPMLASKPDELIVTYAANSFDFSQLSSDARLYWPRFVRLNWNESASNQSR